MSVARQWLNTCKRIQLTEKKWQNYYTSKSLYEIKGNKCSGLVSVEFRHYLFESTKSRLQLLSLAKETNIKKIITKSKHSFLVIKYFKCNNY